MGKIRIMSEHLANKIAAGEVVERPASVVKELVENAIDANSTQIEIAIEDGGLSCIKVRDNGDGMDEEDCKLAFERHATSKIRQDRDLFRIGTLGFRGEALPSIAAVSRVELVSNPSSSSLGTRIQVEGGMVLACEQAAAAKGTEVCVRDLFYNTPARLKYLKSIHTEVAHISDYVNRLALSYPEIAFHLRHNGKTLLQTTGDGRLLHVIAEIYGASTARQMVEVKGETIDFQLDGYLAKPEVTRANRSYISFFVNGRYIKNQALTNAVLKGYHTLLPLNRYPIAVLRLQMDPVLIDVNVHPAKLEVRLSKEDELFAFIASQVERALRSQRLIPQLSSLSRRGEKVFAVQETLDFRRTSSSSGVWHDPGPAKGASAGKGTPAQPPGERPAADGYRERHAGSAIAPDGRRIGERGRIREAASFPHMDGEPEAETDRRQLEEPSVAGTACAAEAERATAGGTGSAAREKTERIADPPASPCETERPAGSGREKMPVLYPMAQLHGTYILAQNEEGLYLIDQHAAQERIHYEYFLRKLQEDNGAGQELLFPLTIERTAAEYELIKDKLSLFSEAGVQLEPFGQNTFLVRALPVWFPKGEEEALLEEMMQMVLAQKGKIDLVALREKTAIMMSCKAAIKANRYLTLREMEALLEQLRNCNSPYTCPHGRPVIVHFSTYEIEKMFKRVM